MRIPYLDTDNTGVLIHEPAALTSKARQRETESERREREREH